MESYERQIKGKDPEYQQLLKDETLPWNLIPIVEVFIDLHNKGAINYQALRDYEYFTGIEFTPTQIDYILYMDNKYTELISK